MTDEQRMQLPRTRPTSDEVLSEFSLFAACQLLEDSGKELERRVRLLPDGWRDYRLAVSKASRVATDVLCTFTPDRLAGMQKQLPLMHCKVYTGKPAVADPDCLYMTVDDFSVICKAAHEKCALCMEQHCARCELGKMFDRHLLYDRGDLTWAEGPDDMF